jgi:carbon storage regulator CsrA
MWPPLRNCGVKDRRIRRVLVLSRRQGEKIVITLPQGEVVVSIERVQDHRCRIGFEAPDGVTINREEVWLALKEKLAQEQEQPPLEEGKP